VHEALWWWHSRHAYLIRMALPLQKEEKGEQRERKHGIGFVQQYRLHWTGVLAVGGWVCI